MQKWSVRLKGDDLDLAALAKNATSAQQTVRKDEDDHYYLRSSDFETAPNSAVVHDRALDLIDRINRVARLLLGENYFPIEYDSIFWTGEDGKRYQTVGSQVLFSWHTRSEYLATSAEEMESLLTLAKQNPRLADALYFFMKGDLPNLYKAWELAGNAAGGGPHGSAHDLIKKGWVDKSEQGRFTGTAQARKVLGDEARHASERYEAPKNPMTIEEARAFVRSTIKAWIKSLTQRGIVRL